MKTGIVELLTYHIEEKLRPDGSAYHCLPMRSEEKIAATTGSTLKQVQMEALHQNIVPERYCRNQHSLSTLDQLKLLQAHVAIIGQGGLGGTVTEILARIGVGSLTVVDGDVFEESNLNRQLLSTIDNLGKSKAVAGRTRVAAINPAVDVHCVAEFLTSENAEMILQHCSLAVDCLDSIPARFILEQGCRKRKIPMVSAAIGGNSGQATVIFPGDTGLQALYGARGSAPAKGAETRLGTLPFAATIMAAIECAELVTIVCEGQTRLRNRLLIANTREHNYETIIME